MREGIRFVNVVNEFAGLGAIAHGDAFVAMRTNGAAEIGEFSDDLHVFGLGL